MQHSTLRWIAVALAAIVATASGLFGAAPAGAAAVGVTPAASSAFTPAWANSELSTDAPDPDVIRVGNTYYAYTTGTTWGNHIGILTSSSPNFGFNTLSGGPFASSAFPSIPYTQSVRPWQANASQNAPGVFVLNGQYVMYYTAQTVSGHAGHYCLSVATATSPQGPFIDLTNGPWFCMDAQGGVIDPSPFIDSVGRAWLAFKTYDDVYAGSNPAAIWVARLSGDGMSIVSSPVEVLDQRFLSSPFETVENPEMILADGTYFLLFSRGNWRSSAYRQGVATCVGPVGPCRELDPVILSSYRGVNGPGGGSAFFDASGHWWLAYAGWNAPCSNYSGTACGRHLYVAPMTLRGSGIEVPCSGVAEVRGYRLVASDGGIFSFGNLPFCGSTGAIALHQPIVGMAATANSGGYWLVASDGGIFAFGNARFFGSTGGIRLFQPIVGMAPTPTSRGYWLVASDGGIFAFGDARFFGSTGGIRLHQPIVGMATTPTGHGYWLVARDGGIFAFGDARFYGSTGNIRLQQPVVGMTPTTSGRGYWFVASDGGIFAFGDARFYGSMGGRPLHQPVVGMTTAPGGSGYWLIARDGGIFAFGSAPFYGSTGGLRLNRPIVGMR
jgi:hypothetical protein